MSRTSGFRSIMVPVDGSRFAEAAIPGALAIAERAHCRVRFVLVNHGHYPPLMIEPATVYLKNLTRRFRGQLGRRLSSIILIGPVAPTLVQHAQEIGADLVVMSTHGWGGLRRAWLGSVTDELIRTIEIPVLVIRPRTNDALCTFDFGNILIPLDGSLLAEVALHPAMSVAILWNAEISLLQVVHPGVAASDVALALSVAGNDDLADRTESARTYLGDAVERVRLSGARVSGVVVSANNGVAATILERANLEHAGLVIMATHGRGGISRLVLGSVTNRIVQAAGLPVLVVPHSSTARQVARVQREMIKSPGAGGELARVGARS